ncbi:DUF2283 domain-containing protein [Nguyenibacter vanlangensis]|uniref:DUF2283 domain-containing protein n=1 Tax=Nguyenibacter vanlangensis TaxID=1216886 RepID=A0A7Y7M6H5_9PROT|nr:DUF2283 domain-containing protein [Nguyenibacter vanlangensis]NVN10944.1 DUF2283 domain-containing protein [Nguyenibacter vanlangensis]
MIRTSYDPEADAMFIWVGPEGAKSAETHEVSPGVMLDYDAAGNLIGIEVLDVRERTARPGHSAAA